MYVFITSNSFLLSPHLFCSSALLMFRRPFPFRCPVFKFLPYCFIFIILPSINQRPSSCPVLLVLILFRIFALVIVLFRRCFCTKVAKLIARWGLNTRYFMGFKCSSRDNFYSCKHKALTIYLIFHLSICKSLKLSLIGQQQYGFIPAQSCRFKICTFSSLALDSTSMVKLC